VVGTPALRARLWENQVATEELLVRALAPEGGPAADLGRRVLVAGCLATVTTALLVWVEGDGKPDLPSLVVQAFSSLRSGVAAR
jgi:hypothetical protein